MQLIQGKGVSKGVANGPLYFYQRNAADIERKEVADVDAELARFEDARQEAMKQLQALYEKALVDIGEESAALFEAHQMMLDDLDYVEGIQDVISSGVNAEAAVIEVAEQFAEMLLAMDDEYMQGRAADVKDISDRVIGILSGCVAGSINSDVPVILAADDLTPSETVQMDKSKIIGFVTMGGSASSHTAILARTMGIPAIIGVGEKLKEDLYNGKDAIIDGETGEVFIEADEVIKDRLLEKQAKERAQKEMLNQLKGQPNVTVDGKEVMIYCNIGSTDDLDAVLENDGGGIGLFRSEFLYLQNTTYPTEEQQFQAYKTAAQRMGGKRVIIRTLDIGADKQADYFELEKEENPAMGLRAIRICLTRPEVFKTQLRALYRASVFGKIAIMFPMITSVWEVREIKRICQAVQAELKAEEIMFDENVELGIMLETPASVMMSAELAKEVDFFSVGTNDLTQYTLAVDRQGANLDRFFDAHHPAVLRMIKMAVDNAHKEGIWLGICGELAADAELTETFLAIGVDELSVTPSAVLPLRNIVRSTDTSLNSEKILAEL